MDADADRLAERREHDLAVQEVVDRLAEEGPHEDPTLVADRLVERLTAVGVVGMPGPWVDSVVTELVAGNPYVVSPFTEEHEDVPEPTTPVRSEVIE
ncbi:hypothetical protein [Phycicoccus sp. DTK01]|uniref:hypothetical protein n=1 Tax=Phycicoccus sp. DTK01 TaxID=2785745 RepID=UPI001A8DF798|nr:hypothetical protein [Phycicoccus sp. DTK01]GIL36671.1 hypothetical protein PDTK01_27460 [Phycicoccus sp. DTK01]